MVCRVTLSAKGVSKDDGVSENTKAIAPWVLLFPSACVSERAGVLFIGYSPLQGGEEAVQK
jgi:hypothetical protein